MRRNWTPRTESDDRFLSNGKRVRNQIELDPILDAAFQSKDRDYWLTKLEEAGIPAGPINSIPEVFNEPQVVHREMLRYLPHPLAGQVPQVMSPLRFANSKMKVDTPPPLLGQHTTEILDNLGFTEAEIEQSAEQERYLNWSARTLID